MLTVEGHSRYPCLCSALYCRGILEKENPWLVTHFTAWEHECRIEMKNAPLGLFYFQHAPSSGTFQKIEQNEPNSVMSYQLVPFYLGPV